MTKKFERLTRPNLRALAPGQVIREHGIKYEKLPDGDGRFYVEFRAGDGRRVHRTVGLESDGVTRTEAEALKEKLKTEAREDRFNLPKARKTHMSFEEAAEQYIQRLKESDGKNIAKKEIHLRLHLNPFFKSHRLNAICDTEIGRYKKKRKEVGAAIATINRELATLSHLLNKSLDWGWITTKPRRIGLMKENNARMTALTNEECERLLKVARIQDEQLYLFIRLGLSTGMRYMEILSVALNNIDIKQEQIYLPKTKTGPRMQQITSDMASFLDWYIRINKLEGQKWLFPSRFQTKTGHRTSIDDAFRTAVINAELDPNLITPHIMRHTVETRLAENGLDFKARMEFLGHKTPEMALRYDHVTGQRLKDAANLLEKALARS